MTPPYPSFSTGRPWLAAALATLALTACGPAPAPAGTPTPADGPPPLEREMRGVWVASVANIDWPSRPGLSTEHQQWELLRLLDRSVKLGLNAVVLQVRPGGDALYDSPYEPWSEYLTGEMGLAPEPFWDPLEFAVQEAHRRGLELHAWFNPYRARHPSAQSPVSDDHLSRTRPDIVREYGRHLWMDPGEPDVQDQTARVILDVVRRYDVDGIHIDDYFYPYREAGPDGELLDFPDEQSWQRYREAGGTLNRNDWRRSNVDTLVERLYREIKVEKPWVRFGISPFGIWRPGHPPQIEGFDAYDQIYADARKWLLEGWVDYFTPQLYWPIAQTPQSYPVLLRWWVGENRHDRHIWPGNFTSRVIYGAEPHWPSSEVLAQIYVTRGQEGATGNVHFSMRGMMGDPDGLSTRLATEAYATPALAPASPWLWNRPPGAPELTVGAGSDGGRELRLVPVGLTLPTWWGVRLREGDEWRMEIVPGSIREIPLEAGVVEAAVSAVDRVGNEGPLTRLPLE